jgi:molybdopterin-guanine dinucleotide biosynthesis protein MobB
VSVSTPEASHRRPPLVGVCGMSGSGKTLLIQQLVPCLTEDGLRVAVVKHCTHRIEADTPGKDSDRIFRAGADVLAAGPSESFVRVHADHMPLEECLQFLGGRYDLILVEGCRAAAIPKIWIGPEPDDPGDMPGDVLLAMEDVSEGAPEAERLVRRVVEQSRADPQRRSDGSDGSD